MFAGTIRDIRYLFASIQLVDILLPKLLLHIILIIFESISTGFD